MLIAAALASRESKYIFTKYIIISYNIMTMGFNMGQPHKFH